MKRRKTLLFIGFGVICVIGILNFFQFKNQDKNEMKALFSWSSSKITEDYSEFFDVLDTGELNTIFQTLSSSVEENKLIRFLEYASHEGIAVYGLTGTPEWAYDPSGKSMIEYVERINKLNQKLPKKARVKGIVMDVEPYLLDDYKTNSKVIMKSFVEGLKATYKVAKDNQLEFIVCIPYYYDTFGFEKEVEMIIGEASDQVAVMNYYLDKEIPHIETEAKYSSKYNKGIINIYELQPPGKSGLTEKNTYYNRGLVKISDNFKQLKEYYKNQYINIAYHEYHSYKEIMSNE
jgi:hypothetical protein